MGLPICSTVTVFLAVSFLAMDQCSLFFSSNAGRLTTSLQRGVLHAALSCDVLRVHLALESVERRTDHVVRVRGAGRLGDDVVNAEGFEDGALKLYRVR